MNIFRWLRGERKGVSAGRYMPTKKEYLIGAIDQSITVPSEAVDFPDVSFYQGVIDFDKMAANTQAVIIRIGQNTWIDSQFERNYAEAKARGLKVGGYWFFDGRASSTTQANYIKQAMSGKSFEMELFIDWEKSYNGAYEGLKEVVALMQAVESLDVYDVGLYTGYYWFVGNSNASTNGAQYSYLSYKPLWIAWYSTAGNVRIPPPWIDWTHWQYGTPSEGYLYGAETIEIDKNKHNGDLRKYGITPPITGETMYYKCVNSVVIRDAAEYPNSTIIGGLANGDVVRGEFIVTTNTSVPNWVHFGKVWRNGVTPEVFDGYASANTRYLVEAPDFVPPDETPPSPSGPPTLHIRSDGNDIYPAFDYEIKPK